MPLAPFVSIPDPQNPARRALGVNPVKQHVRGFWLNDPDNVAIALAANGQGELRMLVDSQGHFDWAYIIGQSTGAYILEIEDTGTKRILSNGPLHRTNVVGSARRPFRLPEPYFLNVGDGQREIIIRLRDISGSPNTVRLVLYGRRFYHKEATADVALEIAKKFDGGWRTYSYFLIPKEANTSITQAAGGRVQLAGSAADVFTFEMDSTADMDAHKLMVTSDGNFTFQLRERDTGRSLANGAVHSLNGWGNAEFPFYFADSYLLERKKHLLFEVTDLSGTTNNIYATIAGRRLQIR